MAKAIPDIKPSGLSHADLVDALYYIVAAIKGICAKLDDDGGVTLTTYEANVYTAIFNGYIENSKGDSIQNQVAAKERLFYIITPRGFSDNGLLECLYDIFDMLETLTEQCDTDALTDNDYESLCYTAIMVQKIENSYGNILGNGSAPLYFRPGGVYREEMLVDFLYNAIYAIDTLAAKLDDDATVTDTDYEALWYTAFIYIQVENAAGSLIGKAKLY